MTDRHNALPPGTEIEGYRIERVLGAGGFGITYLATETMLDRAVALKEYLPGGLAIREADGSSVRPLGSAETGDFEWGLARFKEEARTLVNFQHPNIVPVLLDFGSARASLGGHSRSLTAVVSEGYAPQEHYSSDGN
jgi:serine/threonine protein kinase